MADDQIASTLSLACEAADDCACFGVRQLSRRITRSYDEALRPTGLKVTQFTMLAAVVAADGSVSLSDLAGRLGMDRSTFSRNLKPLVQRGLVRHVDAMKGRSRSVRATKAGRVVFLEAEPAWRRAQARLRDTLGKTAFRQFVTNMQTIGAAI